MPAHCCGLLPYRYGGEHKAVELQKEVVYGLTELNREAVK
jgi:N-acetyl-gamma-glutamylphosphate reductase